MNTRQQILIDKLIAKPVAFALNFLVRVVGQILRLDHSMDKPFKTIAVCKFKGMGSIIQATPMLHALRQRYPDAEIIFVSTRSNSKVLEKIDLINTVVLVDDSGLWALIISNIKALLLLMRKRPEVYFDLEIYSDYSTIFTTLTMAQNRVGFYLRSSSFRLGIYTHMMFFNPRAPIAKVYLQMAYLIGCEVKDYPLYQLQATDGPIVETGKPYIVINPNASDLRLERRWGQQQFVQLIERLLNDHQHDVYLVGSKDEKPYVDQIAAQIDNSRLHNAAGATSIDGLIDMVARAELMISNDTGPMHVAFSTRTPVVCLFGPCAPDQYSMSDNAYVIYKDVYCSPCVHDFEIPPCKGNNVCMQLISIDEVYQVVNDLLLKQGATSKHQPHFVYQQNGTVLGQVTR